MTRSGDFWSRRRAAVAAETEGEIRDRAAEDRAEEEARLADRSDADLLAELDLPAPEDMDTPDQVQALLKSALPQRLKTRALRRLWRLNPVLANVDGLVDYGEDYTDAALVVENLQTLYKVGKGMFDKAVEAEEAEARARARAVALAQERDEEQGKALCDAQTGVDPAEAVAPDAPGAVSTNDHAEDTGAEAHAAEPPQPQETGAGARRMRFRFETAT